MSSWTVKIELSRGQENLSYGSLVKIIDLERHILRILPQTSKSEQKHIPKKSEPYFQVKSVTTVSLIWVSSRLRSLPKRIDTLYVGTPVISLHQQILHF